jgi:hypothetical protein
VQFCLALLILNYFSILPFQELTLRIRLILNLKHIPGLSIRVEPHHIYHPLIQVVQIVQHVPFIYRTDHILVKNTYFLILNARPYAKVAVMFSYVRELPNQLVVVNLECLLLVDLSVVQI